MKKKHIEKNLFKMIENVLKKHKIIDRILTVITDNASNNTTFFYCLVKNISNITKCVDIIFENDDEDSENNEIDLIHVFCLTHVLQLILQTFLDFVRVNSINDELQKN
jgi:hypothetical protein